MIDFLLDKNGDMKLTKDGDTIKTASICQAVKIRLLWFFHEWRLMPDLGFPYLEEVFIKNPSESKIHHLIRNTIMSVKGVTDVQGIKIDTNKKTREAAITVEFCTDEDTYREEVNIKWQSMV